MRKKLIILILLLLSGCVRVIVQSGSDNNVSKTKSGELQGPKIELNRRDTTNIN